MRYLLAIGLMALSSAATAAISIADVVQLPSGDRAQINVREQDFFDFYARNGMVAAIEREYKAVGQSDLVTAELRKTLTNLESCGTLTSIQRYKSENTGSLVVRDSFAVIQGNCLLQWELTYIKLPSGWSWNRFNVSTFNGNDWKF